MAKVLSPFMSVWASGSIGKCLTCRPQKDKRFIMASFITMHPRRTPNQDIGPRILMWKMKRYHTFFKLFQDQQRPVLEDT